MTANLSMLPIPATSCRAQANIGKSIPWVEKYRPKTLEDIVLDPLNKAIIERIIENNHFPNILLYGPPGTGKTTTIINIINCFQEKYNQKNKDMMIHLNASDERGIDIIRNQIQQFVNSHSMFNKGIKFVILDEVDYMTKNAQQALKYLLQGFTDNVRFCLICNYISRIDESLQNEFVRLRFNQLPEEKIIHFLSNIITKENINITPYKLQSIQRLFKSDIRSMINYIQSNQYIISKQYVINHDIWEELTALLQDKTIHKTASAAAAVGHKTASAAALAAAKAVGYKTAVAYIQNISVNYNMEIKNIIKDYLNYIIRQKQEHLTSAFLVFTEYIMHVPDAPIDYILNYTVLKLHQLFNLQVK